MDVPTQVKFHGPNQNRDDAIELKRGLSPFGKCTTGRELWTFTRWRSR